VDVLLSVIGALVATWLAAQLFRTWRARKRLHAEIWSLAFTAYALGMWALVFGHAFGWTSFSFRSFYFLGAIANIPLLAAGSIALHSDKGGQRALRVVILWLVFGFFATFLAPFLESLPTSGVPEGSDVFAFTFQIEALTLPGPRMFAAISGAVGSIVIIGLALVSAARSWRSMRRLAYGNLLIVAGALVPAFGGSLTALGESAALTLTLTVGIVLLWAGYRLASTARSTDGRDVPAADRTDDCDAGAEAEDR
jgi:hypothetical protein